MYNNLCLISISYLKQKKTASYVYYLLALLFRMSDKNCSIHLQLRFLNSCGNDKYSTRKIEADDKNLLKVAIYDYNNEIITREPFSSMRVCFVAIHGDFNDDHKGQWTQEYFHSKIVTGRPGKEHLLSGNLYFRLQNGEGHLDSAKFQDNSSFVPSKASWGLWLPMTESPEEFKKE